ncbi:hypothetical protein HBI24_233460 [Parastagonospora nodorum]|nr:hypothetical protein HBH46_218290 [Parastagonospora nodorum]KAH4152719.1 hypothetical protein HBH43_232080 [Parastagonospora nodorum]KAH4268163.1 hypothetical protein HBI03_062370 [Parastagonospora nodorum]KAH4279384.1 hypothetical protein HBI04_077810 [Parastagonospora nodorum]KAH4286058.1 hypothetical protein HBI01_244080 [Parastagonospora nodorum]
MIRISWCAVLGRGACSGEPGASVRCGAIPSVVTREPWNTAVRLVSRSPTSRECHFLTQSRVSELAGNATQITTFEVVLVTCKE